MPVTTAEEFLTKFAALFVNEEVQGLQWTGEDDIFGKNVSWNVGLSTTLEAIAEVDLGVTQLQLSISERDVSGETDARDVSTSIVFDALVSFEEKAVTLNGASLPYSEDSIRHVISEFNERA